MPWLAELFCLVLFGFIFTRCEIEPEKKLLDLLDNTLKDPDLFDRKFSPPDSDFLQMINSEVYIDHLLDLCGNIVNKTIIGYSVKGNPLTTLILSDNPSIHEPGEPEIKFIANMHGDEIVGRYMLLNYINFLCKNYNANNENVKLMLEKSRLHFLITMNPDSNGKLDRHGNVLVKYERNNANDIDLNRNFPSIFNKKTDLPQPETKAVMHWIERNNFILSISLHGGAYGVSYPFDDSREAFNHEDNQESPTPDNEVVREWALTYSRGNRKIFENMDRCYSGDNFENGIINGLQWYIVTGSMSDWEYAHSNSMELTAEIGCIKDPNITKLMPYWKENRASLLVSSLFLQKAFKGFIFDGVTRKPIKDAKIIFPDGYRTFTTRGEYGDYWKFLPHKESISFYVSHKDYRDTRVLKIDGTKLPLVDYTQDYNLNITLWPKKFPHENYTLGKNNSDDSFIDPRNYGLVYESLVQMYPMESFKVYKLNSTNTHMVEFRINDGIFKNTMKIEKISESLDSLVPDLNRTRLMILFNLPCYSRHSSEIGIRTIRHFLEKSRKNSYDNQFNILSRFQLLIIPSFTDAINTVDNDEATFNSFKDDNCQFSQKQKSLLKGLVEKFKPHILLTYDNLQTGERQMRFHTNLQNPNEKENSKLFSKFEEIIWNNTFHHIEKQFSDFILPNERGKQHQSLLDHQICPDDNDAYSQTKKNQLEDYRKFIHDTVDNIHDARIGPMIHASANLACLSSYKIFNYNYLPWLWIRHWDGLEYLLHTFLSHSYCGQVLGQINVHPNEREITIDDFRPPVNVTFKLMTYMNQYIYQSYDITVEKDTGIFCRFLPSGEYMSFVSGSANPAYIKKDSVAIKEKYHQEIYIFIKGEAWFSQYEYIILEFALKDVSFESADDLIEHIRKYNSTGNNQCATSRVIGYSKKKRPIYAIDITPKEKSEETLPDSSLNIIPMGHHSLILGNFNSAKDITTPTLLVYLIDFICKHSSGVIGWNKKLAMLKGLNLTIIPVPNPDQFYSSWTVYNEKTSNRLTNSQHLMCQNKNKNDIVNFYDKIIEIEREFVRVQHANSSYTYAHENKLKTIESLPELNALYKEIVNNPVQTAIIFTPGGSSSIKMANFFSDTPFGIGIAKHLNEKMVNFSKIISPILASTPSQCVDQNEENKYENISDHFSRFIQPHSSLNPEMYSESFNPEDEPINSPYTVQVSLCPGCHVPSNESLARLWIDSDLPGLILNVFGLLLPEEMNFNGILGQVVDQNHEPLPEARVHVDFLQREWMTKADTHNSTFFIPLPLGEYRLAIRSTERYKTLIKVVNVTSDKSAMITFVLERIPTSMLPDDQLNKNIFIIGTTILLLLLSVLIIFIIKLYQRSNRKTYAMAARRKKRGHGTLPLEDALLSTNDYKQVTTTEIDYEIARDTDTDQMDYNEKIDVRGKTHLTDSLRISRPNSANFKYKKLNISESYENEQLLMSDNASPDAYEELDDNNLVEVKLN